MKINFIIQGPLLKQSQVCAYILAALPDWFGIPEANEQYIRDCEILPTFVASIGAKAVGFLTLKAHSAYSSEIHVMGVLPSSHRMGIGRALVVAAEDHLRELGVEYLQVKTLSSSHPDPGYAKTRAFYLGLGFRPLEEFPTLWGEANPCLQMVKYIHIPS